MKKLKFLALAAFFSLSMAATANDVEGVKNIDPEERVEQIETRVHEIWKMDFSQMDKVEKVAIRTELKELKKEVKGLDSKVSISIGAIIIILLILIIIT